MSLMSSKSPGEIANGTFSPSTPVWSNQASISSATFSGRADHHRSDAADADMLGDFAYGPYPVGISAGDVIHRRAAGVVLDVTNLLIQIVGGEIDPRPSGHQGKCALMIDVAAIVGVFGSGFGFGPPENDGEHAEHQYFSSDCVRLSPRVHEWRPRGAQ